MRLGKAAAVDARDQRRQWRDGCLHAAIVTRHNNVGANYLSLDGARVDSKANATPTRRDSKCPTVPSAATAAAALMIAATGVSSASAAAAPSTAKLVTPNQAALLDSHSAVVTAQGACRQQARPQALRQWPRRVQDAQARRPPQRLERPRGADPDRQRHRAAAPLRHEQARGAHGRSHAASRPRWCGTSARSCSTSRSARHRRTPRPSSHRSPIRLPTRPRPPGRRAPVTDPAPDQTPPLTLRRATRACSRSAPPSSTSRPTSRWTSAATAPATSSPNGVHDPLQVRAFFVGHGKQAVTFVSVDAQGWFAAYQAPNAGDGADDARAEAAAELAARGYDVSAANVVVSATHDHAAPTIHGHLGPHRPRLPASRQGGRRTGRPRGRGRTPVTPSCGPPTARSRACVSQVQGTDQMAGFAVDDRAADPVGARAAAPARRSRRTSTCRRTSTSTTRSTAPEHQFSADYPGWVRDRLAETLGGTSVIAAGTLGRQEAIGADSTYDEVAQQGRFITNALMRALTHAHRITDTTLGARRRSRSRPRPRTPGLLGGDVVQPPRRPARLPGSRREPAANNGDRHVGLERGRHDLHDQPLAARRRSSRPPRHDRHVGDRRPRRRSGVRHRPGRGVPGGHRRDPALVRGIRRHPRRAHHRPRRRPARLLLGSARRACTRPPSSPRATSPSSTSARTSRRTTSTPSAPPARRSGLRRRRRTRTPRSTTRTRSPSRRSSSTRTGSRPTIPR